MTDASTSKIVYGQLERDILMGSYLFLSEGVVVVVVKVGEFSIGCQLKIV
tara:strand:+ start:1077 stop:1226 length:150 start_codon:yes stop_codon:yes gene_type:complete